MWRQKREVADNEGKETRRLPIMSPTSGSVLFPHFLFIRPGQLQTARPKIIRFHLSFKAVHNILNEPGVLRQVHRCLSISSSARETKHILLSRSIIIILIPITRRFPLILKLDVNRQFLLPISIIRERHKTCKLWRMVNRRVVSDRLDPPPLAKALVPLTVFFDAFEDVGSREQLRVGGSV